MVNLNEIIQDRYRTIRLLGSGGFGAVYMAEDQRLGRMVAIKEIDVARLGPEERPLAEQLFEREARMLASLDHPGLTRIWDYFQHDRRAFLVMEYVPGRTLRDLLHTRGGPLDEAFVLECALQLCAVLAYLHARRPQVIFRDLKPANVMVVEQPQDPTSNESAEAPVFRLIDFGIARLFKPDQTSDTLIIGTPGYAPPEQYGQGQTNERSDIYSLGATLHHLLCGRVPNTVPPPPLGSIAPTVSADLARVIARATEVDPADRYQNVEAMRRDLLAIAQSRGAAAQSAGWAIAHDQPAPTHITRTASQFPLPPALAPARPRQSSSALLLVLVLAVVGIVTLGGLALGALNRLPGQRQAGRSGGATAVGHPTVAPAAQDWQLPSAPGRIVFGQSPDQTGYNVLIATLDGKPPRPITDDNASISPAWSPDGRRLAITRGVNGSRGIFIGAVDGSAFEQVSPADQEARYPAWSPDGQQIAFALRSAADKPWQLAIMQLSNRALTLTGQEGTAWIVWSQRGALAYSALTPGSKQQDIFALDPGGTPRNLSNTPDAEEDFPAWSPAGDKLAFVASPPGDLSRRQIFVMNADGGGRTQLTSGPGPHTNPVWSPDGKWIAYLAQEASPDWQVWAMRADGSEPRQITFTSQRKFYLAWVR
jgi:hypothetical protein